MRKLLCITVVAPLCLYLHFTLGYTKEYSLNIVWSKYSWKHWYLYVRHGHQMRWQELYLKFDVDVFCDHFLCELTSDKVPLYQKQERADWMFSDCLALAFMALVFIFALACITLERRNCNTSAAKTPKGRPKRRKRVTRSHCEDHHGFTGRRGPDEHGDDESYNPRGKIIR